MGVGTSREYPEIKDTPTQPNNTNLKFRRCLHLTHKEYLNNDHIPNIFFTEKINANIRNTNASVPEALNFIERQVKDRLNSIKKRVVGNKIPLPIYVACAKKLEVGKNRLADIMSKLPQCTNKDIIILKLIEKLNNQFSDSYLQIERELNKDLKKHWDLCNIRPEYNERRYENLKKVERGEMSKNEYNDHAKHFNYWRAEEYWRIPLITNTNNNDKPIFDEHAAPNSENEKKNKKYLKMCMVKVENTKKREKIYELIDKLQYFKIEKIYHDDVNVKKFTIPEYKMYEVLCNKDKINNIKEFNKTSLVEYVWKGNIEIIIYIPNLDKNLKYFPNKKANDVSNLFMVYLLDKHKDAFVISNILDDKLRKNMPKLLYDKLIKKLPFMNDMTNMCYNLGCASENGEDLASLLVQYNENKEKMDGNITRNSPFFPTKCLRPKNFEDYSFEMTPGLEYELSDKIRECTKEADESFAKESQGADLNNLLQKLDICFINALQEKRGEVQHYSKWNHDIMRELSQRYNNRIAGVQEISFPVFEYMDMNADMFVEMPWGNRLVDKHSAAFIETQEYTLPMKSPNSNTQIKLNSSKQLTLFHNNRAIRVFHERIITEKDIVIILSSGKLTVRGSKNDIVNDILTIVIYPYNYKGLMTLVLHDSGQIEILTENYGKLTDNDMSNNRRNYHVLGGLVNIGIWSEDNDKKLNEIKTEAEKRKEDEGKAMLARLEKLKLSAYKHKTFYDT
jgi:hypothetical protein